MGYMAIRKIIYNGDKYYFESPFLNDGLVIIEGPNGYGKSTLINLIYYSLGGRISGFDKNNPHAHNKHTEIYYDTNNFVEITLEIDNNIYELTRTIGDNKIFIMDSNNTVIETHVRRDTRKESQIVFSDWILDKLNIEVFDLVQGTNNFKINFSHLLRLIYHDQFTDVDKIYKDPEINSYIVDSLEIRKAIFEVLVGEVYDDFYRKLGEFKLSTRELDKLETQLETYDDFIRQITTDELPNELHINSDIKSLNSKIELLENERNLIRLTKNTIGDNLNELKKYKHKLYLLQNNKDIIQKSINTIQSSIDKLLYLIEDSENEIEELKKIRFVDKKLQLFSPDSCPYCLSKVPREANKCICGNAVDESQYEKFFYSNDEYNQILAVKEKSIVSLKKLLRNKYELISSQEVALKASIIEIEKTTEYILDFNKNVNEHYASAKIRRIDDSIANLKIRLLDLKRLLELAEKKSSLFKEYNEFYNLHEERKIALKDLENKSRSDILSKRNAFSSIYFELMRYGDTTCHSAKIREDYMPDINLGNYKERSALVPKRLLYFLTLLLMSLNYEINYPRFLIIDTPNKEGIDQENLIRNISLLEFNQLKYNPNSVKYQIILTTGLNTYPKDFDKYVTISLNNSEKLLKEKKHL